MELIGITSSNKNIYFQSLAEWRKVVIQDKQQLMDSDLVEGYCLMEYFGNLQMSGILSGYEMSRVYALEFKRWLKKRSDWSELQVRYKIFIREDIFRVGKAISLEKFW